MQLSVNDTQSFVKNAESAFYLLSWHFCKLLTRHFLRVSSKCNCLGMIHKFCKKCWISIFLLSQQYFMLSQLFSKLLTRHFLRKSSKCNCLWMIHKFCKKCWISIFFAESAFFQNCWLSTFFSENWTVNTTVYQFANAESPHIKTVAYITYNKKLGGRDPWVTPNFRGRDFTFNRLPAMVTACLHTKN